MSESSIPALSTNGAEQDFSTFMYGVWITNLSNSHVDIKEDNINTTSIHRLQNLNVLLMRSPFPARIHQVCFIPFSVRRFSGTSEDLRTRGQEESYSKSAEYRASGTPRASGPLPLRFARFAFAVHSWPPEMFWSAIALQYQDSHLDTQYIFWWSHGGKYETRRTNVELWLLNLKIQITNFWT